MSLAQTDCVACRPGHSNSDMGGVERGEIQRRPPASDQELKRKLVRDLPSTLLSAAALALLELERAALPGGLSTTYDYPPCLAQPLR